MLGEQVYFWRRAGKSGKTMKARKKQEPDRWIGPAVVLSATNSMVWLSYHRQLLKVAVENLRRATAEELMSTKCVLEEMASMNEVMTRPKGIGQTASFLDLTGGNPDVEDTSNDNNDEEPRPQDEPDAEQTPPSPPRVRPENGGEDTTRTDENIVDYSDFVNRDVVNEAIQPKNTQAGRGTRELNPKAFDQSEREAFQQADVKQLNNWKAKDAITVILEKDAGAIPKDRICCQDKLV